MVARCFEGASIFSRQFEVLAVQMQHGIFNPAGRRFVLVGSRLNKDSDTHIKCSGGHDTENRYQGYILEPFLALHFSFFKNLSVINCTNIDPQRAAYLALC